MAVVTRGGFADADDCYEVWNEAAACYRVDLREGVCTCPDYERREPEGGCKHQIRTEYVIGERDLPAIPDDRIDYVLRSQRAKHTDAEQEEGGCEQLSRRPDAAITGVWLEGVRRDVRRPSRIEDQDELRRAFLPVGDRREVA